MKYILMLGGSGFIGSNLVCEYLRYDKNIIVFGEIGAKAEFFASFGGKVIPVNGSLEDKELIESIFKNYEIEMVIHLVSILVPSSSIEEFILDHDKVVLPTIHILNKMVEYNVRKFVYLSSGGTIYGDYKADGIYSETDTLEPICYYGLSKLYMENLIKLEAKTKAIDYLIVRPSNPFGKFQNSNGKTGLVSVILGKIARGETLEVWGDGSIRRDYIPITYLCSTIAQLTESNIKNEVFNIGSGVSHSINDIIRIIEGVTNKKVSTRYVPTRNVDVKNITLNIEKLKSAVELQDIHLEESIKEYYEWFTSVE